jgi:multisubunit Na+/H+ antiporter MnhE subunit
VRRAWRALSLALYFLKELTVSNLRVAGAVLSPDTGIRPGFLVVPLELRTERAVTALASMITLTPGTLTVDVADDRSHLLVHCMFLEDDPAAQVAALKRDYERRIREVFE